MSDHDHVNGEMLLLARQSRGHGQKEVADAAGVSQGLISRVEHGLASLRSDQAASIAAFLHYPVELLHEQTRLRDGVSGCLFHSQRKTLPLRQRTKMRTTAMIRDLNVAKLLEGLSLEPTRRFRAFDSDEYGGPEEVAQALRRSWRLPPGPIPDLVAVIESAAGIIISTDFGSRKFFGMSCWTEHGNPIFFINRAMPMDTLRWTIAHELGHLTMDDTPSPDPEGRADRFAAELLAPAELVRPGLRRLSMERLPALKLHWRVSMKALIRRAKELGAVSEIDATRLYKQYSARGFNRVEPYPITEETPTLVREAIRIHTEVHGYSIEELAMAVRLNLSDFRRDFLGEGPGDEALGDNVVQLFG